MAGADGIHAFWLQSDSTMAVVVIIWKVNQGMDGWKIIVSLARVGSLTHSLSPILLSAFQARINKSF